MGTERRGVLTAAACVALLAASTLSAQQKNEKDAKGKDSQRPKLTLRAQPLVGITPVRVVLTAELVGGADDFEEYYCPTVEWDWGDDTRSESSIDCEPYEAAKSEIKRRFTIEHVFRRPGAYKVYFRLKRRNKAVAVSSATLQMRPGGASDFDR